MKPLSILLASAMIGAASVAGVQAVYLPLASVEHLCGIGVACLMASVRTDICPVSFRAAGC